MNTALENLYYFRIFYFDPLYFISMLKQIPNKELREMIINEKKLMDLLDKRNANVKKNLEIYKEHLKSRSKNFWE